MKKELGSWGEARANEYLREKGYKILFTNYRTKIGEIDIIATKGNSLSFIEVKTRSNELYGKPREAVNYKKQLTYARVAEQFIQQQRCDYVNYRFDVIEIIKCNEGCKIQHIEEAFGV